MRIKDAGDRWREDIEGIQETLLEYFRGIFTSSHPLQHELDSVLNTVRPKVTEAMNAIMSSDVELVRISSPVGPKLKDF
ncbi:UNVERIFIED_CONTAM: hypothetical protein Sradi_2675100 [Sesamum radiatum]|uniref:Uncharacterized protein n=1 Tax=Sesamum radiatum TaxID=300843 RepID=A0AAW2S8E6_SESRA